MKRKPNLGWRCTHCDEGRYYGKGSSDMVVQHIKEKHPKRYAEENWMMVPIRNYEKEKSK